MLNRTQTVERLILLRQDLTGENNKLFPCIKKEQTIARLDKLLLDLINPPQKIEKRIIEIINLALKENITPATASVAIQELIKENQQQASTRRKSYQQVTDFASKKSKKEKQLRQSSKQIEEMEKNGWI